MADRTPNDLADALPPVCPTCGSDTPTTYFGSCFDNQHSTIFDPRLPLDPWHAYMAELAHLRRQVDSLNAYVGVGQELLQKAEAKVRVQGEQLDTLRNAIGDPDELRWHRWHCEATGSGDDLRELLVRIADAVDALAAGGGVPEEGATDERIYDHGEDYR